MSTEPRATLIRQIAEMTARRLEEETMRKTFSEVCKIDYVGIIDMISMVVCNWSEM